MGFVGTFEPYELLDKVENTESEWNLIDVLQMTILELHKPTNSARSKAWHRGCEGGTGGLLKGVVVAALTRSLWGRSSLLP